MRRNDHLKNKGIVQVSGLAPKPSGQEYWKVTEHQFVVNEHLKQSPYNYLADSAYRPWFQGMKKPIS